MSTSSRIHEFFAIEPNALTRSTVDHPVRYAVESGAFAAVLLFALSISSRLWVAIAIGVGVGLALFVFNLILWRAGGPGERWYRRRSGETSRTSSA